VSSARKLGFNATWSMAVGGMIGGGIFSTLGVVIALAGSRAWMSFLAAGIVALISGYSYARLSVHYGQSGGAFMFLRHIHASRLAGSLSWILMIGYVLTNSVYAFTFGHYLAHVLGAGDWVPRVCAVGVIAFFTGLNLRGVGEAGAAEIVLVWFKLSVLIGLSVLGVAHWKPEMLSQGVPDAGVASALFGAASIFMAYEGFQLLTYDYDDIRNPDQTLPRAILLSIVVVVGVYILVTLGVGMLVGAGGVVAHKEVALSIAGRAAMGVTGLVLVTIAAAFSTGSAINATLFSTARLAVGVAEKGELPAWFDHRNRAGVPDRAVVTLGSLAALLAAVGSLTTLVEAASLAFLFTFTVVNIVAFRVRAGRRAITAAGVIGGGAATSALVLQLVRSDPEALAFLAGLVVLAAFGRPWLLRRVPVEDR
jgi:amino acid transporter